MRVLIADKVGGLQVTRSHLNWIEQNISNPKYKLDEETKKILEDDIDYYKNTLPSESTIYPELVFPYFSNYYEFPKLRSCPIIVDAFLELGGGKVEDIEGDYYKIVDNDDGTEYIITPDLNNFTKGWEN